MTVAFVINKPLLGFNNNNQRDPSLSSLSISSTINFTFDLSSTPPFLMARAPASSLFHLCTRKRITFLNFKAILFNHSHTSSPSLNPFRPFSTHLLNPRFLPSFSQSLNLSCVSTLPKRPFYAAVDEGGADGEPDGELDVGTSKGVDFKHGNEVSDHVHALPNSNSNYNVEFEKKKKGEFMHVASCDPVELYNEFKSVEKRVRLNRSEMEVWLAVFRYFVKSDWASNQALTIYINFYLFPFTADKFRSFFRNHCPEDVAKYLLSLGPCDEAVRFLFPIFVEFCLETFPNEIKRFKSMVESVVPTEPYSWYWFQDMRKNIKQQKIIYHCGPTNSGKTYNALQRFMEAKRGIYCGPHRLLALEVFDKVKAKGAFCGFDTKQEKHYVRANHFACTVEMASTRELYDVAIIDEIQMLGDPYRGFSWTRLLLQLRAPEIHLCGDPSVLDIVRKICQDTGDELHEQQYERFKPLVVEEKTLLGNLQNIRSGDCVVAFSMREIFELKLAIERETNHRCCVIHGDLPLKTRTQEANLFNDQSNEYDVLVASDVVGMGLDLNIRRVVFNSLTKYNWDKMVRVPASQVKQIAGRAGPRGCIYPDGLATTLHLDDLDYLIECLKQPFDHVTRVWVWP